MLDVSFATLFDFQVSPAELIVRGSLMYWFLFLLFRFVLRRDAGSIGLADILLLVIIADASQNAMAGPYESVSEGMVLVSTIAAWNWLIDWAGYRSPTLRKFLEPPSAPLVRNGRMVMHNLRKEMITRNELMSAIRQHGVDSLDAVHSALLESDGSITVITRKRKEETSGKPQPSSGGGADEEGEEDGGKKDLPS